jgi:ABC-type transporter Mla subunit MlaD
MIRERCAVSGGEVAGILVAVFWAILVSFLAVALARLAQTLRATTRLVAEVTEQAVPLLADASSAVRSAQEQLDRVDAIATDVQEVTSNASALSTTVASTFGGPLVKVAAFGYGVRQALGRKGAQQPPASPAPRTVPGRTVPAMRRTARAERRARRAAAPGAAQRPGATGRNASQETRKKD